MAGKRYLNPEGLPEPPGYSQVVRAGDTVYIAGQGGQGDPESQVRQTWRNLKAAVEAAGGGLEDIVMTTVYLTDVAHAPLVRKVRAELYAASHPPASTIVEVSALAGEGMVVEIEAIAVLS
jgi:enamine deaminase RidA (YjgF/YER057c/UK114 family)